MQANKIINDTTTYKTIHIHNIGPNSNSKISNMNESVSKVNAEEFAKLDALLEDLLAEVEQPLFFNKENNSNNRSFTSVQQPNQISTKTKILSSASDIERSVDWLNEQKERLKSRKEMLNKNGQVFSTPKFQASHMPVIISEHQTTLKYEPNNSKYMYSTPEINIKLNNSENGSTDYSSNTDTHNTSSLYNKPPISPNRSVYSPMLPQSNISFKKNYNELDDEIVGLSNNNRLIENDFDRFSQRSYQSNASTIQKTKYHIVSNDYVECTRPAAATPLPIQYSSMKSTNQNKRALSAPPQEVGKVFLQRMELKSPITVRQTGSAIPFEDNSSFSQKQYLDQNGQLSIQQRSPMYTNSLNRQHVHIANPYNNRGVLKSNQMGPTRSVYLNRAYSENPNIGYKNGYDTDTGVPYSYGYQTYNTAPQYAIDSVGADRIGYQTINNHPVYSNNNTGSYTLNPTRGFRYNDQSGYDTDTGLIKLKSVLDNKRATSRNGSNGYYYMNRSITPVINYNYPKQNIELENGYNGYIHETRFNSDGLPYHVGTYPIVQTQKPIGYIENDLNDQIVDGNFNGSFIEQSVPGYMTPTNNTYFYHQPTQETQINSLNRNNSLLVTTRPPPQQSSMILHKQVAPSAYPKSQSTLNSRDLNSSDSSSSASLQYQLKSQSSNQTSQFDKDQTNLSTNSLNDGSEVIRNHPKSLKATQHYWYKPKISREEAINLLKDKVAGTFLIRDSNNFPGAFGLALKVDKPPPNVQIKPGSDPSNELVRHFLIEPTSNGVKIKGCCNEPVFGSLAALVYQHSLTQLALPTKLILPTYDISSRETVKENQPKNDVPDGKYLLEKGAACNVYYLNSVSVENNKVGLDIINKAINDTIAYKNKDSSELNVIQFKVTSQGITLTDLNKKKFLRQQFPTNTVIYCAIEEKLTWPHKLDKIAQPRIFGLICKPRAGLNNYECHLFVELDPDQPAIAIVDFINRYLIPSKLTNQNKSS